MLDTSMTTNTYAHTIMNSDLQLYTSLKFELVVEWRNTDIYSIIRTVTTSSNGGFISSYQGTKIFYHCFPYLI